MNSIDVKMEKANAIFRYRSIQRITILFRFIEICVFLVVISTFSYQLPFSARINVDYFREFSFACFSPKFVFVIGNVIILILLFKSGVADNGDPYGTIDVYDEYVKRCEKNVDSQSPRKLRRSVAERTVLKSVDGCGGERPRPEICRSQSEKLMKVECEDTERHMKLRRSVTERKMLKNDECLGGETPALESGGVDELSSEAFRLTVEAFIARQQKSLRDEELAPVAYVSE